MPEEQWGAETEQFFLTITVAVLLFVSGTDMKTSFLNTHKINYLFYLKHATKIDAVQARGVSMWLTAFVHNAVKTQSHNSCQNVVNFID